MDQVVPENEGSGEGSAGSRRVIESGAIGLSGTAWSKAQSRASVIAPLAAQESVSALAARDAARSLNVSERTVYSLLGLWRQSGGLVASLAPRPSPGGRGKGRLTDAAEQIVAEAIRDEYLSKQKKPMEAGTCEAGSQGHSADRHAGNATGERAATPVSSEAASTNPSPALQVSMVQPGPDPRTRGQEPCSAPPRLQQAQPEATLRERPTLPGAEEALWHAFPLRRQDARKVASDARANALRDIAQRPHKSALASTKQFLAANGTVSRVQSATRRSPQHDLTKLPGIVEPQGNTPNQE